MTNKINDLSNLKNMFPDITDSIQRRVKDVFKERTLDLKRLYMYYKCGMMEVETKLKVLNEEFKLRDDSNPIESIKSRLKSPESLIDKMMRRGFPLTIESVEENVNDIAGIRVVCSFKEDVYSIADALLKQDDIELIEIKDYIKNPKPSGYRSLHVIVGVPIFLENEKKIVRVEIQFRTIAMDFWASLEHQIRYKKEIKDSKEISDKLLECAEIASSLDESMSEIKKKIND